MKDKKILPVESFSKLLNEVRWEGFTINRDKARDAYADLHELAVKLAEQAEIYANNGHQYPCHKHANSCECNLSQLQVALQQFRRAQGVKK